MADKVKYTNLIETQMRSAVVNLAYDYLNIRKCKKCGYPGVAGYCCNHCGDVNPSETYEQESLNP